MSGQILYRMTDLTFRSFSHIDLDGAIKTIKAENIPMMRWPNGRWCLEANVYIQSLYERGLSRQDRGGTLHTYATQISELLRFCHKNNTDLIDLNDAQFSQFVRMISNRQPGPPGKPIRSSSTVIRIARRCLDFLSAVGAFHCQTDFIASTGRIKATRIKMHVRTGTGKKEICREHWNHRSLPTADGASKRTPISAGNVTKLREAVLDHSSSVYLRKRRYAMLALLEATGARRFEIARLKVSDVTRAASMTPPMLRLVTAKRGGNKEIFREIPVSKTIVNILMEFINKNRRVVIRRTIGSKEDSGYFFLSETTGNALATNTLTQELHSLRKFAKIEEPACAHMFRHAFVTRRFYSLVKQHNLKNPEDFRRALMDIESLKIEVQQLLGQKNPQSIDPYIHSAFVMLGDADRQLDAIQVQSTLEEIRSRLVQLEMEMPIMSSKETLEELRKVIAVGLADIACRKT